MTEQEKDIVVRALTHFASWVEGLAPADRGVDDPAVILALRDDLKEQEEPLVLPGGAAERLHGHGTPDDLYVNVLYHFFDASEAGAFSSWEREWYDPETGKSYRTFLKLEMEECDDPQTCPWCGEDMDYETDSPSCPACGRALEGAR